ncbi:LysR family transcriptional regulator [Citrobacter sp. FP75]|uniref:LysR family transcriptional regulator n=1 Tax=Citrobacter sp. FP75 TaxID=1852949 RepID=UPI001BC9B701|nr:LysR family transcriptional regulator [Citrobacter sp. FP75]
MTRKKALNLNLIPVLCALVETHSVSEAAKRLGVANSVISYSLGGLRTYYGDPLMVRTGEGMRPTGKAIFLYKKYRTALDLIELDDSQGVYTNAGIGKIYRIRTNSLIEVWLVNQMMERNPIFNQCTVDFVYPRTTQEHRLDALRKRFVDIDFGTPLEADRSIMQSMGLIKGATLMCRRAHSRIKGDSVDIDSLGNEELVHWISYAELSAQSVPVFNNDVLSVLSIPYRSSNIVSLISAVSLTDLLCLVPTQLADFYSGAFDLKKLSVAFEFDNVVPVALNVHKDGLKDPVISELVKILKEKFLS